MAASLTIYKLRDQTVMNPAIQCDNVSKVFDGRTVLQGCTFQIQHNETIVIVGRSGGGKSVLMKILLGLMEKDSGEVYLDGQPVCYSNGVDNFFSGCYPRNISVVFQQNALFDSMTVLNNIIFMLRHRGYSKYDSRAKAKEMVSRVGLKEWTHNVYPDILSGGMAKRLAIARSLADDSNTIFLDEPTSGLDVQTRNEIIELFKQIKQERNATLCIITHDPYVTRELNASVLMIDHGSTIKFANFQEYDVYLRSCPTKNISVK